ncbi:MAG: hypothetical protein B7Z37_00650 [Verrucomicrobia bacterium 12-59-8]|nr:MAG: hypothetical protein B7Z37_00650 [Verrucomicrobia bacterium 12-59-8]
MCSLTWHHRQNGYEVFFNRDEKKTRGRATPPAPGGKDGVRHLCPRDADAGGTWLLANEHGVTLALLNFWGDSNPDAKPPRSRGLLLCDLLAAQSSASAVVKLLHDTSLEGYGSFTLAVFDLGGDQSPLVVRWNRGTLVSLQPTMPLCSSSFFPEVVLDYRQRSFKALRDQEPATLWNWHRREESPTACTVRMNRPDAQTWSSSRVSVTRDSILWHYVEEMPGLSAPSEEHEAILKL